jgi:hypothetical protein
VNELATLVSKPVRLDDPDRALEIVRAVLRNDTEQVVVDVAWFGSSI